MEGEIFLRALLINASPKKDGNTARLLGLV